MKLCVGTSGFSYKKWKGKFYPDKHPDREMLSYYSGKLTAVEINNTFYRMPRAELLEGWAAKVPESFRFSLKASRRITHFKKLKETAEETGYLVTAAGTLAERLGVFLFQLPPTFPKDLERLDAFLAEDLPEGTPAAFEFRHDSWMDDEVFDRLRGRGCALCIADTDSGCTPFVATAPLGYLRLRKTEYSAEELKSWAERVRATDWESAFVFFKHEDEATGPHLAMRFLELTSG